MRGGGFPRRQVATAEGWIVEVCGGMRGAVFTRTGWRVAEASRSSPALRQPRRRALPSACPWGRTNATGCRQLLRRAAEKVCDMYKPTPRQEGQT
jgi:hypothetical protein